MYDNIQIGNNEIKKHEKYKDQYKINDLYWGLGIEHEVYLEFENKIIVNKDDFINNHKRERYSVDYFSNYKSIYLNEAFNYLNNEINDNIVIPILLNSNSFTKTDYKNNSKTLFSKKSESNPKFLNETLIETLEKDNNYFNSNLENDWLFDGDTIEFINKTFYNVKLCTVFNELNNSKKIFIDKLNNSFKKNDIFTDYGKIKIMEINHPFAMYMTNLKNIAMFNNGTLHYNLTLPTLLDDNGLIKNKVKFVNDHKKAIKIIQYMEPFILAIYCSKDPFSSLKKYNNKNKFSNCSQRCAISRYIGIGTYNTDIMECGKVLVKPIENIICNDYDFWWFNEYYKDNAYIKLKEIGLDINFNKHYNHGIELRFFDHIADNKIYESFEFIIYLMDYILESEYINNFENPIINKIWNKLVLNIMKYGKEYTLTIEEQELYAKIFDFEIKKNNISEIYYEIYCKLVLKYNVIYKSNNNSYILKPSGLYSSYCLSIDDNINLSIKTDILNNLNNLNNYNNNILFSEKIVSSVPLNEKEIIIDESNINLQIKKNDMNCCLIM